MAPSDPLGWQLSERQKIEDIAMDMKDEKAHALPVGM